jgi:minor extracellular serine protease Vpr
MDKVRVETGVDQVHERFGKKGQGVIVGIIDRGIDYTLSDFRNPDGSTRIELLYDLTDDSDTAANGNHWGVGTIYNKAQIQAAIAAAAQPNPPPRLKGWDALGHGTSTTGIAAGNGSRLPSGKYAGIAPEASIIAVKIEAGAVAHGAEDAEPPKFLPERVPVAIEFIKERAGPAPLGLNKPCVMLLNIGSQGGPTDGTSSLATLINNTVGPGKPGLVFVTGSGDDGGMDNRARGTVTQGGTTTLTINKGATPDLKPLRLNLWYSGSDRFDVRIVTPSATYPAAGAPPYASPPTNGDYHHFETEAEVNLYHRGSQLTSYGANSKREITIDFVHSDARAYSVQLTGSTISSGGVFNATLNPSQFWDVKHKDHRFTSHVASGSIWDAATAQNNVCPGDYVLRNKWTDLNGVPRPTVDDVSPGLPEMHLHGEPGRIWEGSSTGPTFDGRHGVDVVAPGDHVFTSYGPSSVWQTNPHFLIQDGGGFYGKASAVSAAAPIVTGIVALMLQRNPELDAEMVKGILQRTARWDLPGPRPNPIYGWGKVNALGAVREAFVTNLTVLDADNAAGWSIETNLQEGDKAHGGRASKWTVVSPALRGKDWIRTSVKSRTVGTDLATFRLNAASIVYVCRKPVSRPLWLDVTWTSSTAVLNEGTTSATELSCLQKSLPRGALVTLGKTAAATSPSIPMYTVVIDKS